MLISRMRCRLSSFADGRACAWPAAFGPLGPALQKSNDLALHRVMAVMRVMTMMLVMSRRGEARSCKEKQRDRDSDNLTHDSTLVFDELLRAHSIALSGPSERVEL